ncbi:alpha/beta fold hydrolase [Litorimonas haliclonae]|uniref:alpha/beta fold hydrolase n=1 Tax=Litorimonas haliclonae TaxID=2081977 RepID=UPI0039EFFEB5
MTKTDDLNWRQLDTASVRLNYLVAGSAAKPTLVFLPGWAGDARFWEAQASYFSKNYHVIAIDLPGWGRSEFKSASNISSENDPNYIDLSLDYLASQMLEVLRAERVKKTTVIGHSLGGMVALAMGAQSPDTVSQVVGAESFIYLNAYPAQSEELTEAFIKPFDGDFDTSVDLLTQSFFAKHTPRALIDTVTETMKSVPRVESIEILRNFFLADLRQYLEAYPGPVSAIVAADNEDLPAFVKTFGDAIDIIEIKDSCHFVMMSEAVQFNAALEKLLS